MNRIDYLEFTCPKEPLETPKVELVTTPFYARFLNKKRSSKKKKK